MEDRNSLTRCRNSCLPYRAIFRPVFMGERRTVVSAVSDRAGAGIQRDHRSMSMRILKSRLIYSNNEYAINSGMRGKAENADPSPRDGNKAAGRSRARKADFPCGKKACKNVWYRKKIRLIEIPLIVGMLSNGIFQGTGGNFAFRRSPTIILHKCCKAFLQ